jgi:hypothetical protein
MNAKREIQREKRNSNNTTLVSAYMETITFVQVYQLETLIRLP